MPNWERARRPTPSLFRHNNVARAYRREQVRRDFLTSTARTEEQAVSVDFLKTADFLQEELQIFYRGLRCGRDERERQAAIARLRAVVTHIESMIGDPSTAWQHCSADQRWGYLRTLSHLGTATHELKRTGTSL
ncbi:MAG: hypothetical protein AB1671_00975 [Thermodesulfobacteriota bacterium]|jgi:hypothetical protein